MNFSLKKHCFECLKGKSLGWSMLSLWKHSVDKLPSCRLFSTLYTNKRFFYQVPRKFHTTSLARLKTLFTEDEQRRVMSFINELSHSNASSLKIRNLRKVIKSRSEHGPLRDVNDLLEKYNLSSASAIYLCNAVLKKAELPKESVNVTENVRDGSERSSLPRSLNLLKKSIRPNVSRPARISSFTALAIAGTNISFIQFEKKKSDWEFQQVSDWNGCKTTEMTLTDLILKLWTFLPYDDCYVIHSIQARGPFIEQNRTHGAVLSLMCAKQNFVDGLKENIFDITGTAPARFYHLMVGNEVVSPQPMVSLKLNDSGSPTPDDHSFLRSLNEVNFSDTALIKYNAADDDLKEHFCQSLLVGKTFVDYVKALSGRQLK